MWYRLRQWIPPWFIYHFTLILWHIERKWLLKRNLPTILLFKSKLSGKLQHFNAIDGSIKMLKSMLIFQIFQLKWKFSKHFTSPEQQPGWRKLFSPHQIKASYVSGSKIFERRFTGLYRHLLSQCTKTEVLGHLEMVQYKCFFWYLAPIRNMFLAAYIFYNVEWVEVRKMSEIFWAKL